MSTEEVIGNTILHEAQGGICKITLNRPEAANALLVEQREVIIEILKQANQDSEVRVVVLAANGRQFCSGGDTGTVAKGMDKKSGQVTDTMLNGAVRLIEAILDCSKPVVAVVQGAAAGMGAHIALACDLVIAAEEAFFVESYILRGMVVDAAGTYLLPRRVGLQKAKEMCFLGDKFSATEAARLGLINKVVPLSELPQAADEFVGRLANAPTLSITLMKRLLNQSLDTDRRSALVAESFAQEVSASSHDIREGITAFVEKRKPNFKGY